MSFPMLNPLLFKIGAASGALSIALGAFGAHALQKRIQDPKMLENWKTASQYHMMHSGAACIAAAVCSSPTAASMFLGGNLLFSGSLYAMVLTDQRKLGMVTPIGGLMYILGWLFMMFP